MSRIQRLIRFFVPAKTFAAMEADTRQWVVTCTTCGTAHDLWDMGGIRFKSRGDPVTMTRLPCKTCDRPRAMRLQRRDPPPLSP
jgi:hypothetical protein